MTSSSPLPLLLPLLQPSWLVAPNTTMVTPSPPCATLIVAPFLRRLPHKAITALLIYNPILHA